MKRILLLLSLCVPISVFSQPLTDSASIRTRINADIIPNGTRSITAAQLNRILNGYLNIWPKYDVDSLKRSNDSVFYRKNQQWVFGYKDSVGSGGGSSKVFQTGLTDKNNNINISTHFLNDVQRDQQSPYLSTKIYSVIFTDTIWWDGLILSYYGNRIFRAGGYTEQGLTRITDTIYRSDNGGKTWVYHGRLPYPLANVAVLKPRFPGEPTRIFGESLDPAALHRSWIIETYDFTTFTFPIKAAAYGQLSVFGVAYNQVGDILVAGGQYMKDTATRSNAVWIWRKPRVDTVITKLYSGVNLPFIGGTVIDCFKERNGWHYLFAAGGSFGSAASKYSNKVYGTPNIEDSTAWVELDSLPSNIAGRIFYSCSDPYNGNIYVGNGSSPGGNNRNMSYFDMNHKWHDVDDYVGLTKNLIISNLKEQTHAASMLIWNNALYQFSGSGAYNYYMYFDTSFIARLGVRDFLQVNERTFLSQELQSLRGLLANGVVASTTAVSSWQRKTTDAAPWFSFGYDNGFKLGFLDDGNSTVNVDVPSGTGVQFTVQPNGAVVLGTDPNFNGGGYGGRFRNPGASLFGDAIRAYNLGSASSDTARKLLTIDGNGDFLPSTYSVGQATSVGGGSGTVNSGTANKMAYYPSTGTTVDDNSDAEYLSDGTNDHWAFFTGTKRVWIGAKTPGSSYPGVWFGSSTPAFTGPGIFYDQSSGLVLNAPTNQTFQFRTNNTNWIWIDDDGGVSIGPNNYNVSPGTGGNVSIEGKIGVGKTGGGVPTSSLSVGTTEQFQVNSSGNIIKVNNVTTSWPSSQGSSNTVFKNDGSGNLSWTGVNSLLTSGTYTPTLTNTTNVSASTAYVTGWYQVGDMVTVFGKVDVDPTTTITNTELRISLPVATAFINDNEAGGTAAAQAIAGQSAAVSAVAGAGIVAMKWNATDVTNQPMFFQFSYKVTPP